MSIGKDLASIRKKQGLTLEEIQSSIKIPLSTLEGIENDAIFSDYETNKTYVRSFVRSFARALQIPEDDIVNALDDYEAGLYNGSLLSVSDATDSEKEDTDEPTLINKEEGKSEFDLSDVTAPDIVENAPGTPSVKNVNWADMGKKFSLQHSTRKVRITVIAVVILVIVLLLSSYFLWDNFSGDPEPAADLTESTEPSLTTPLIPPVTDDVEQDESLLGDETDTNEAVSDSVMGDDLIPDEQPESAVEQRNEQPVTSQFLPSADLAELPDTLTLVVYAAFDKLEPVRVTSDFNWRTNPFWMEKGLAYQFDFRDSILVRGQYSRMLLIYNGHVIENPVSDFFNEEYDSILLTRDDLQSQNYLNSTDGRLPENTELPYSITYGIRY